MHLSLPGAISALSLALSASIVQAMPATQNPHQSRAVTWRAMGCYSDSMTARVLATQIYSGTKNTNAACQTKCGNAGYKYAGTEYGSECWCGNTLASSSTPQTSGCNKACSGSKTGEICGGGNRLTLYTSAPVVVSNTNTTAVARGAYTYRGCYTDSTTARSLPTLAYSGNTNTVDKCVSTCSSKGFATAGVEYGVECYCGNSLASTAQLAAGNTCNMPCPASSTSGYCGAGNRLQIYSTSNQLVIPPAAKFAQTKTVRGVNLGGWFVIESWMNPDMITKPMQDAGAIDEYTIAASFYDTTANLGGTSALQAYLEQHWSTWMTEADFAQMASYGLNTVRIPLAHWYFNASSAEPYLGYAAIDPSVPLGYISQAIRWAQKYNLDVLLDMHTAPGSVNGYDNGGRQGPIQFMTVDPANNMARLISALVKMVQIYVNDPSYGGIVKGIEIINEPVTYSSNLTQAYIAGLYNKAAIAIRGAVTSTAVNMPTVVMHDGFQSLGSWDSTYSNATTYPSGSYIQDTHQYQAWAPLNTYTPAQHITYACNYAKTLAGITSRKVIVGEWSLATNCTNCTFATMTDNINSQNSPTWNIFMRRYWEAQVIAYETNGGWIFWSWKTFSRGDWSYKDAVVQGWIPQDPTTRAFKPSSSDTTCVSAQPNYNLVFATTTVPPAANSTNSTSSTSATGVKPLTASNSTISSNSTSSNNSTISSSNSTISSDSANTTSTSIKRGPMSVDAAEELLSLSLLRAESRGPFASTQSAAASSQPLTKAPITGKLLNQNAFPFLRKLKAFTETGYGRMIA